MRKPQILSDYQLRIEQVLKEAIANLTGPERLIEAMGYSLLAGGKRLRPALLLAVCDLFEKPVADPMQAALAFEFIHTYSLIHDDLPAMDNDDLRRGRPTNHVMFGEAMAVLAGDGLLTEAFGLVANHYIEPHAALGNRLLRELVLAAGVAGMVGGQGLDLLATGEKLSVDQLQRMHQLKTGAMIVGAVRCGGLLGNANEEQLASITRYGEKIGLAFQVADDILDVTSNSQELGKSVGKDEAQQKNTYVSLLGLDKSRTLANELISDACSALEPFGEKAAALQELARFVVERTY